jgi:hypothetical protein
LVIHRHYFYLEETTSVNTMIVDDDGVSTYHPAHHRPRRSNTFATTSVHYHE